MEGFLSIGWPACAAPPFSVEEDIKVVGSDINWLGG